MGMSIDNSIRLLEDYLEWQKLHKMDGNGVDEAIRNLIDVARKYQMFQADYVNRLKADMVAMLDEIRLQAEENIENIYEKDEDDLLQLAQHNAFADYFEQYNDLIQQKINALKGGE